MAGSAPGAVDIHAHFWPRGLLRAAQFGKSWHGWHGVRQPDGLRVSLDGRVLPFPVPEADLEDLAARHALRVMRDGVSTEALMPAGFLWGDHLDQIEAAAYCREINAEAIAAQNEHPAWFYALAILPLRHPSAAIHEVSRAANQGCRGFALPTNVAGMDLDHPSLRAVLDAIASTQLPIVVHPNFLSVIGGARLDRLALANSIGNPTELALAAASLILSGYFDRHHDAKAAFCQAGGSIGAILPRLDHQYKRWPTARGDAQRAPSCYLQQIFIDSLAMDRVSCRSLLARFGATQMIVGTDYPFMTLPAAAWPSGDSVFSWLKNNEISAVLRDNAIRFFNSTRA